MWIEANVHSSTKNTLNLLLFYVPIYPSLNVTFIEIILVYMVKSTKTTKRNNWCYISGLVFFWTLVRDMNSSDDRTIVYWRDYVAWDMVLSGSYKILRYKWLFVCSRCWITVTSQYTVLFRSSQTPSLSSDFWQLQVLSASEPRFHHWINSWFPHTVTAEWT